MQYYFDLWKNVGLKLQELISIVFNINCGIVWKKILLCAVIIGGFSFCWKMIEFRKKKISTPIGTVTFWTVLSLATLGLGGVVGFLINEVYDSNKVYAQSTNSLINVFLPTVVSYGIAIMSERAVIPLHIDPSLALFIGVVLGLVLMISAVTMPINREMYIQVSTNNSCEEYLKLVATNRKFRRELYIKKDLEKPCSQYGKDINAYKLSRETISQYLLLSEEEDGVVYQKYLKPNGRIINVAEVPNLAYASVLDCVSGIIVAVMFSTPYISEMLSKAIGYIG